MINELQLEKLHEEFNNNKPFRHVVIDNFFTDDVAQKIVLEFPDHNSEVWTVSYNNPVEIKKACSHWDKFPSQIYSSLFYLCSREFEKVIEIISGESEVISDYGLHGGGMHSHCAGGKLNIHKDYSIHPKLPYKRNFNAIIYMTPDWKKEWGGGIEFWSHDEQNELPKECVASYENKFNRAVIFDTTQNSWHGLPQELKCPENISRKSLAIYYLTPITKDTDLRKKAFFTPYGDQYNDPSIMEFCKKRSQL
jgi:Rps23 Pro-64 3,4-dihydroxylase Tpa1-like proline 4-hydroxylase